MAILNKENTELQEYLKKSNFKISILFIITLIFFVIYKPISIIALIILIYNLNSKKFKLYTRGFEGENYAKNMLLNLDDSYHLFCDVTVQINNKTSQLDTIVVGDNGVFIIEVKNIKGNITGDILDYHLKVKRKGRKGKKYYISIYNPYREVKTHVYRLDKYLKKYDIDISIIGLVFFKCNNSPFIQESYINVSNSYGIIFDDPEKLLYKIKSTNSKCKFENKNDIINKIKILVEGK
ncbi:TPA: nuclease-related domain-containing protein [Clostridium perfringens]